MFELKIEEIDATLMDLDWLLEIKE
jgi:hypothetical protein